ncbi:MAG: UDP-N-acetyl-D-galactosamine dehydrogenase [Verrucomicrobiales bacterium]|jgi:UDP-N-acetyl-D-galactosamine dehydrogenase
MVNFDQLESGADRICVVGLGYVGLPLAVRLASKFRVIGFDIDGNRVAQLRDRHDHTGEIESAELATCGVEFTTDPSVIGQARIVIVTVPTPIDGNSRPDLRPILGASRTVGANLAKGAIVVYESTVYPGLTEEECVPLLEEKSGLTWKRDFHVGYSPERINPGDKVHTVDKIVKVVSGDTAETAELLAAVYGAIITAGIHVASSIKVAEAAKVIENTQRDLNIALMNELALIFGRLDVSTEDVLAAAGTKWNFLPFTPGLVGGHCIGVDPYYLTHKAESVGYHPQVILAGRRINDGMGKHVAEQTVKHLIRAGHAVRKARVLVLGLTFKENVPDLRNTRVIDIIRELRDYEIDVDVHDPQASAEEARHEYEIDLVEDLEGGPYDAVILAVKHAAYRELGLDGIEKISTAKPVLIDIKWLFDPAETSARGIVHWRL